MAKALSSGNRINGADGNIIIGTSVDMFGMNTGLKKIQKSMAGLKNMIGTFAVANFFSDLAKQAIDTASDLQEVQNIVDVAFEDMAYKAENFANVAIEKFGMSRVSAKQTAGSFMAMGKSLGLSVEEASNMSVKLTGLTGDMASFYNISQDYARVALSAVYTGETETLKRYGIVLTEANLQQYALTQGITTSVKKLDARSKALLRYKYIMESTKDMQGDFERTSGSWANQTRLLKENWTEFLAVVGSGLIQVLSPLLQTINAIIAAMIRFAKLVGGTLNRLFGLFGKEDTKTFSNVADSIEDIADATDDVGGAASGAAKQVKKLLAPYDELNVIAQNTASNGGSGGAGGIGSLDNIDFDVDEYLGDVAEIKEEWDKTMQDFFEPFKTSWDLYGEGVITSAKNAAGEIQSAFSTLDSTFMEVWSEGAGVTTISSILSLLQTALETVGSIASAWKKAFKSNGKKLIKKVFDALKDVLETVETLLDTLKDAADNGKVTLVFEALNDLVSSIASWVSSIAKTIKKIVQGDLQNDEPSLLEEALGTLALILNTATLISETVRAVWDEGFGEDLLGDVLEILKNIVKTIKSITKKFREAWTVGGRGKAIVQSIANIITTISDGVKDITDKISEWASKIDFGPVLDGINGVLSSANTLLQEIISGVTWMTEHIILPFAGWVIEEGLPVALDVIRASVELIAAAIEVIGPYLEDLYTYFIQPLAEAWGENAAKNMKDIASSFDLISKVLKGDIENITGDEKSAFTDALGRILAPGGAIMSDAIQTGKSLGRTVVENMKEEMGNKLAEKDPELKEKFNQIWTDFNTAMSEGDWEKVWGYISQGFDSWWKQSDLKANFDKLWADITGIFSGAYQWFDTNVFTPISQVIGPFVTNFKTTYIDPISKAIDEFVTPFKETFLDPLFSTISGVFKGFTTGDWKDFKKSISGPLGDLKTWVDNFKRDYLEPVLGGLNWLKTQLDNIWTIITGAGKLTATNIKKAWDVEISSENGIIKKFNDFKGKVNKGWEDIKQKFETTIVSPIKEKWKKMTDDLKLKWQNLTKSLSEFFKGFKSVFNNIVDGLKNIWKKATEKLNSYWETFTTGIKSLFRITINGLLKGVEILVNWVIDGLNVFSSTLADMADAFAPITGTTVERAPISHWTAPTVPLLAQGAVIPPNKEFMAILGDQKHGVNIETPLDTMLDAFRTALSENNTGNNNPIVLQLNGKDIARAVWDENEKRYKQTGRYGFAY